MNIQAPSWMSEDKLKPEKPALGPYRYMVVVLVGLDIPVMIYGMILIFQAAGENRGLSNLINDNYGSPSLWIAGFCVAGHLALLIGTVGVLLNKDWWDETIKVGAGLVFVFQVLAIGVATSYFVGKIFEIGQGRLQDPDTEQTVLLTAEKVKELAINTFLTPRMFATVWLSITQMILLMYAVEKDKSSR